MRTSNYMRHHIAAAFACVILTLGIGTAKAQGRISVPNHHVMHGTVVAVREVRAYANALGASTNMWGDIQCGLTDQLTIKKSTIFRVETASHYYDLSKVCGMSGDFRRPSPNVDDWQHWEQLRVGDHVDLLFEMTTVQLSIPRCKKLGRLSKSFEFLGLINPNYKIYRAHCIYKVPIMHVRIRYSYPSTLAGGSTGPIEQIDQTWDFRLVGTGPRAAAETTEIGSEYSSLLPPAW